MDGDFLQGLIALVNALVLKEELLASNLDPYLLWYGKCVTDEVIEHILSNDFELHETFGSQKDKCPNCNSV